MNENLLRRLEKALKKDPEADLYSIFPSYHSARLGRSKQRTVPDSSVSNLNRKTLEELQDRFARASEVDLHSAFPASYSDLYTEQKPPREEIQPTKEIKLPEEPDLRHKLDPNANITDVFPLSHHLTSVLATLSRTNPSQPIVQNSQLNLSLAFCGHRKFSTNLHHAWYLSLGEILSSRFSKAETH
jgi:hypothetical protein